MEMVDGLDAEKMELIKLEFFMDPDNRLQAPSTPDSFLPPSMDFKRLHKKTCFEAKSGIGTNCLTFIFLQCNMVVLSLGSTNDILTLQLKVIHGKNLDKKH
jgi:hypothetical protein